jgi:hypothetical protein
MRVLRIQCKATERRGVILLVVLAMLTLLTVIGVTFVLYADNAESTARISMESEKTVLAGYRTDELMAYAFGQLIYDVEDDDAGQRSGLRGHSLARDMYGYYYTGTPSAPTSGDNDRPFRGIGRLEAEKNIVNFTTFNTSSTPSIRDPERPGNRAAGSTTPNAYIGGFNPPYTSPDLNHVYLARSDDNGNVVEPSFTRFSAMTDAVGSPVGSLTAVPGFWTNPDTTGKMKTATIRPRPAEHNSQFPGPAASGDVRNLPWGTQNDSVWIDLGVPPKTAANGKRYKPLFAFLVQDLDGRANVNAHGNVHGRDASGNWSTATARHASGQGWGAWEVSLQRALSGDPSTINPADTTWKNLFLGSVSISGRQLPSGLLPTYDIVGGNAPHTYAPVNYNGSAEPSGIGGAIDQPILMPGCGLVSAFLPFASGNPTAYGMGASLERSQFGTAADTNRIHGALFHPFVNFSNPMGGQVNRRFEEKHLAMVWARETRNPTNYLKSDLVNLNLFSTSPFVSATTPRDRRFDRITSMSWDLDRPGITPFFTNAANEGVTIAGMGAPPYPVKPMDPSFAAAPPPGGTIQDYDSLFRSNNTLADIKRLGLNRNLSDYPALNPMSGQYVDMAAAAKATSDRQTFAKDLLLSLIKATGAANPYDPIDAAVFSGGIGSPSPRYSATRWLAQLAVNMVDNLDFDDVMTPFVWNSADPTDILFGHELSRLAINEVYAQVENEPNDLAAGMMGAPTKYNVKVYAELMNPLPSDASPNQDNNAYLQRGTQIVHKLELAKSSMFDVPSGGVDPRDPLNKKGITGPIAANDSLADPLTMGNWGGPLAIGAAGAFLAPQGQGVSNGFLMVGAAPDNTNMASSITNMRWTANDRLDSYHTDLKYVLPKAAGGGDDKDIASLSNLTPTQRPVILLRRLANPGLAVQNDPNNMMAPYNPYITIDFVDFSKDMLQANDARSQIVDPADSSKRIANTENKTIDARVAYGRKQPFIYKPKSIAGMGNPYGTLVAQNPSENMMPTDQPKTTFWRHNSASNMPPAAPFLPPGMDTLETPFPRIHLDRPVTSATELMTTPFCRPHEYLMMNDGQFSYCLPWFDTNTRLYRWLELVQAGDTRSLQSSGVVYPVGSTGGRIPGKINLNTVSREVFFALCDAQPGNRFNDSQINAMYDQVVSLRPFWGNGVGGATGGDALSAGPRGRQQTIFANHPAGQGADMADALSLLMDPLHQFYNGGPLPTANGLIPPGMGNSRQQEFHPSVRLELLNKILGRTTSRSNCFAVWLTVGYFEVTSENGGTGTTAQPAHVLGKELEPKLRRRFFGMVDRTNLEKWRTTFVQSNNTPIVIPADDATKFPYLANPVPLQLTALYVQGNATATPLTNGVINTLNNKTFAVTVGSVITLNPGDPQYEETVEVVADIGMGVPGIICQKAHPNGLVVSSRGNPGPMSSLGSGYKIDKDTEVVPYFAVLE